MRNLFLKIFLIIQSICLLVAAILSGLHISQELVNHKLVLWDLIPYAVRYPSTLSLSIIECVLCALAFLVSVFAVFCISRADISELTKSSVQAYRDRKAARQEAKRQKKIQQAKDTIAELEDKEKDGE